MADFFLPDRFMAEMLQILIWLQSVRILTISYSNSLKDNASCAVPVPTDLPHFIQYNMKSHTPLCTITTMLELGITND